MTVTVRTSTRQPLTFALFVAAIAFGPIGAGFLCGWLTGSYRPAFQVLGTLLIVLWPAGVILVAVFWEAAMARAKYGLRRTE